jgi:hypothetical protein
MSGETLQELAAFVEELAHRDFVGLPVDFIQEEVANAFANRFWDREVKQHLLMGGEKSLNEALNQALRLGASKVAAGTPERL